MTRKKIVIGIILFIVAILIIKEIVAYLPYFMMGYPLGIFGINNKDSVDHKIDIQIFDSNNESVLRRLHER